MNAFLSSSAKTVVKWTIFHGFDLPSTAGRAAPGKRVVRNYEIVFRSACALAAESPHPGEE
jgi:hypothetical protein